MMQRIDEDNDVVVQSCRSTTGKCKSIEITQLYDDDDDDDDDDDGIEEQ